jgi:hypothetical protein
LRISVQIINVLVSCDLEIDILKLGLIDVKILDEFAFGGEE